MAILGLSEEELFAQGHRACAGCGSVLAMRFILKAAGKNTIIAHATGCMEVISTPYPETSWKIPWIHGAFENAAAIASGIEAALKKQNKQDINVIAIGGDGGTFDIGLQALSGAVERNHDFLYVCYDNGAYQNTGIQRSGATPKYAATTTTPAGKIIHGKQEFRKNMPFIMAAHNNVYVATANIAYPQDLTKKIQKGLAHKGPAYVQIFATCQPGWKHAPDQAINLGLLATQTNMYPLFEIEKGVLTLSKKPEKPKPIQEFLKLQGRFKHLNEQEIKEIQDNINEEWEKLKKLDESKIRF